jgi:hypothetical protein
VAILLTGTTDGINLPGPITVTKNRGALCGMAWVRFDLISAANTKVFGYSVGTSATSSRFTLQWVTATPGQLRVAGRALDADPQCFLETTTVLTRGPWFHVVGMIDYAENFGYLYIDGELDLAGALTNTLGAAATANTNSLAARWGAHEGTGAGDQGMSGLIEDGRLYSRILGPAEIKTIYTGEGKDGIVDGLLHRYPFNDQGPGVALTTTMNVAGAERLVGGPVGTPTFQAGRIVGRKRPRMAPGRRV